MKVDTHRAVGRLSLGGAALLLAAGALAGCGGSTQSAAASGSSLPTVTLLLSYPSGWESPIWYGQEQGIFKKDGINLQISAPSGAEAASDITFLSQAKYDAGYVGTYDLPVYHQKYGANVVNVFGWAQQNPICWIVKDSSGITKPQQLAGKPIAAPTSSATNLIYSYFAHYGISKSKVNLESVATDTMSSIFIAGKVAAVAGYAYAQLPENASHGNPSRALCFSAAGQKYEASGIAVNKSYLTSHRKAVADLVKGLVDSFNTAKAHPLAAAKFMVSKFGKEVDPAPVDEQETLAVFKLMSTPNDKGHPYGWMSPQDMQQTVSYDQANYGLKPGYNISSFYTDEFFPKS
jgi:NitT/TauT family transport system substrate-binding protein